MIQFSFFLKDQRGMVFLESAVWVSLLILIFVAILALLFNGWQPLAQRSILDQ